MAVVFAARVLLRSAVLVRGLALRRQSDSPALHALVVDARNDVVVALLALVGFLAARFGTPRIDAWLALPLGAWVGLSGLSLARENVGLLLGENAPPSRRAEWLRCAAETPGVLVARRLRARSQGSAYFLWVEIGVDPVLSVGEGHAVGERVEDRLAAEPDVTEAVVHVEPARPSERPGAGAGIIPS
mgnify:FL=1